MSASFIADGEEVERNWWRPFPGHGQGVVVYNIKRDTTFFLMVRSSQTKGDIDGGDWIGVEVRADGSSLYKNTDNTESLLTTIPTGGFNPNSTIPYWLSYDRDNLVVKYGQGYRMEQTTLIEYSFLPKGATTDEEWKIRQSPLFNPAYYRYAEQYDWKSKSRGNSMIDVEGMVQFDFLPFVKNPSPFVIDSTKVNLLDIDNALLMPSASLPAKCRELYSNVAQCDLDWMENYDGVKLSDAIRYSLNTEGKTLYDALKKKAGDFGEDPNETYLRVTLGYNAGGSPGIPYVLEIWPKDHYSPIHNHGNSFAVIKVLYGGLTVHVFNKMTEDEQPPPELMAFNVKKEDATWISPRYFQTHQLKNTTNDYCATIQCYMYGIEDNNHWPYFDYLSDTEQIDPFLPISDFTFRELRDTVIEEYKQSLTPPSCC